jgi:hypothetical protein
VAQERGFFARHGVAVNLTPTPNSVLQLTNLIGGRFDMAMTAMDNVVAYMEGQGEAAIQCTPDLVVVMGGDNGFLRLVTVPEVASFGDLRGNELSVDALTTGYAFVLRKLLELGGVREEEVRLRARRRGAAALRGADAAAARRHAADLALRRAGRGAPLHLPGGEGRELVRARSHWFHAELAQAGCRLGRGQRRARVRRDLLQHRPRRAGKGDQASRRGDREARIGVRDARQVRRARGARQQPARHVRERAGAREA